MIFGKRSFNFSLNVSICDISIDVKQTDRRVFVSVESDSIFHHVGKEIFS